MEKEIGAWADGCPGHILRKEKEIKRPGLRAHALPVLTFSCTASRQRYKDWTVNPGCTRKCIGTGKHFFFLISLIWTGLHKNKKKRAWTCPYIKEIKEEVNRCASICRHHNAWHTHKDIIVEELIMPCIMSTDYAQAITFPFVLSLRGPWPWPLLGPQLEKEKKRKSQGTAAWCLGTDGQ